jgi:hypothetical protein
LLAHTELTDKQVELVQSLRPGAMLKLLGDLLDLARVEAGWRNSGPAGCLGDLRAAPGSMSPAEQRAWPCTWRRQGRPAGWPATRRGSTRLATWSATLRSSPKPAGQCGRQPTGDQVTFQVRDTAPASTSLEGDPVRGSRPTQSPPAHGGAGWAWRSASTMRLMGGGSTATCPARVRVRLQPALPLAAPARPSPMGWRSPVAKQGARVLGGDDNPVNRQVHPNSVGDRHAEAEDGRGGVEAPSAASTWCSWTSRCR